MSKVETKWGGKRLLLETGRVARQANGAVWVQYGDTVVLVTVSTNRDELEVADHLPLTVNYQEQTYAGGRIPGGFFRREGRPGEKEIITSRLIDRTLRPMFPKHYYWETQIIATVLSYDQENLPDIPALLGASAALGITDLPLNRLISGIRIGRKDGKFIVNPSVREIKEGDMDLVVSGDQNGIVMVEGSFGVVSESDMVSALIFAQENLAEPVRLQAELVRVAGRPKMDWPQVEFAAADLARIEESLGAKFQECLKNTAKLDRNRAIEKIRREFMTGLFPGDSSSPAQAQEKIRWEECLNEWEKRKLRTLVREKQRRIDGRELTAIRPITCEPGILPRVHGSALFTRGETQALVAVTLGSEEDEQLIEDLEGDSYRKFMLHYNFPPFSVGEVKRVGSPGRREIGHGVLASRSLQAVLPNPDDFPYTVRVVSEIMESNGSSSMATVCGSSLALMDAGVPLKSPVAGVAMGLMKEGNDYFVLTDILGDEDHLGDMDLKVAGTREGITAMQMDIKISGLSSEVFARGLADAREARLKILEKMNAALPAARKELSQYAPRVTSLMIKPNQIKDVIGPAGKHIKRIVELTGVKMDVYDEGRVNIFSVDPKSMEKAIEMVRELTAEAEIGKVYVGKVQKIMDFGAFVQILPGTDGLVHISQLSPNRVDKVTDICREGDEMVVKVLDIDGDGKIRLSRKEAMSPEEFEAEAKAPKGPAPSDRGDDRRRDDRGERKDYRKR
ncbi:MAG: polyribonucleotide nucleotidyltransferase [Proteobacteria bacterium]|nr:polyribonucleotide nucleotidyltransferase [Pseudomonadota bacterium]